ncbi:MAG: gamma-glutamylcyclotransferase [Opitutaceae bacterium]|nr:gamma-glutamylcyclotransferase [Opitutaceae bacterium]
MTRLFVYGTLKRGCRSHRLLENQLCLGETRTVPGFRLYHLGEFPGMVRMPDYPSSVSGEVYLVDDDCLSALDSFEGVDEGLFSREWVQLEPPAEAAQGYLYLPDTKGRQPLEGAWIE